MLVLTKVVISDIIACFIVPSSFITIPSLAARVTDAAFVLPSTILSSVAVDVTSVPPISKVVILTSLTPLNVPLLKVEVPSVNEPTVTALGNPIVTVPLLSDTSTSFEVPEYVTVPPNDMSVELLPSETVIELLASFALAIDPASCAFVIVPVNEEVG